MTDGLRYLQQQLVQRPLIHEYCDDIIFEILLRLPAKSLLRFRFVCKSWRALISDSYFVTKHCRRAVTNPNCNSYRLFITDCLPTSRSIDYKALSLFFKKKGYYDDASMEPCGKDAGTTEQHCVPTCAAFGIAGSSNGLICLWEERGRDSDITFHFIVWNPCTGEASELPVSPTSPITPDRVWFCGFGYDSTTQDYKVISGITPTAAESDDGFIYRPGAASIAVFALKTGSWRLIEDLNYVHESDCFTMPDILRGQGCLANGSLHWLQLPLQVDDGSDTTWQLLGKNLRILSFSLAEEKPKELPLSHLLNDECYIDGKIGSNTHYLFASFISFQSNIMTIWVMKEYGVNESWTKAILISVQCLCSSGLDGVTISILEDGKVLMRSFWTSSWLLYDPEEKEREMVIMKRRRRGVISTHDPLPVQVTYVETLVSPKVQK